MAKSTANEMPAPNELAGSLQRFGLGRDQMRAAVATTVRCQRHRP